jgi:hypothetical protein
VRLSALDNTVSLVPFADMANHSVDASTFFEYDSSAGAVVLKADRGYEKGQQVCERSSLFVFFPSGESRRKDTVMRPLSSSTTAGRAVSLKANVQGWQLRRPFSIFCVLYYFSEVQK